MISLDVLVNAKISFMISKSCALNVSFRSSFIDHITPLASLLGIPLIVSDEKNASLSAHYYPEAKIRYWPDYEFRMKELADEFDALISCDYWGPVNKASFRLHNQKEMKFIFCPHGQSDKGYHSSFLSPYAQQEAVLLYGSLLKEMLVDLQIWDKIPRSAVVGNYRRRYYEDNRERLLKLADDEVFSRLRPGQRTLLYAPTWNDLERSGTFFEQGKRLLEAVPSDWNLLIKVHPDLAQLDPVLYYRLSLFEEKRSNFLLIEEFPPIYPLLERADVYLGDYSSIGYDFLAFQKPMFFLQKPHLERPRLHFCGRALDSVDDLFKMVEGDVNSFQEAQKELYGKAFAPVEDLRLALEGCL